MSASSVSYQLTAGSCALFASSTRFHMTERQAEKVANLLIGAAVAGAAVYVLRTPSLRRLAWGLARNALAGGGPAWLLAETRRAWDGSAAVRAESPGI